MKILSKILACASLVGVLSACNTDVDLNADWERTTVVYGLLDKNESTHFVKINKAFLGDGNALVFASIRDSSEFQAGQMNAYVEEIISGSVNRTFPLLDSNMQNKDENGLFYGPEHTVYYFEEPALNENARYRVVVDVQGESDQVYAETGLVQSFNITKPSQNIPGAMVQTQISFAIANPVDTSDYLSYAFIWQGVSEASRYQAYVTLNYIEVTTTDTTERALEWYLGEVRGNDNTEKNIKGYQFYTWVRDRIKNSASLNPSNLVYRKFNGLDFKVVAAGEDLDTYMEVNEPVTGIVQDRPEFTNVVNGIGIFSSRTAEENDYKFLNKNSLEELCKGQFTYDLEFCTDSAMWSGIQSDMQVWCP